MFYTKYRPQKFDELAKPDAIAESLMKQLSSGKIAHAYLFVGPRGTGKTTIARILAKALNCTQLSKNGDVCNKCASCKQIAKGSYSDLIEIDAASHRGIDDIRSLRENVKLSPATGDKKVYIIDEVHMLTMEAFNALLKTLEEPPAHVVFILCTTEDHKVPDTIKSRCQIFKFKRASINQIVDKLSTIASKEDSVVITDENLKKIAQASNGGYRDAENMLQQLIEGSIDPESFSGVAPHKYFVNFVDLILLADVKNALGFIDQVYNSGMDLFVWTGELMLYLRDLMFLSVGTEREFIDTSADIMSHMEEQAAKFDSKDFVRILEIFMEAQSRIKKTSIPQLPLELAVLEACLPPDEFLSESDSISPVDGSTENKPSKTAPKTKSASINKDILKIQEKWQEVLKAVVPYNHSVSALLKAATPVQLEDNVLTLEVSYAFHKERLEATKNKSIVNKGLLEVFEEDYVIQCILGETKKKDVKNSGEVGNLTDYNVVMPSHTVDIFDGALPL